MIYLRVELPTIFVHFAEIHDLIQQFGEDVQDVGVDFQQFG